MAHSPDSSPDTVEEESRFKKSLVWILLIYLLGLALRLIYFFEAASAPMMDVHFHIIDSKFYDLWARTIGGGDLIGKEAFFMGPLYPYFLALLYKIFGTDFIWIRLVQVLLGSFTCVGVFLIGRRLFDHRTALLAALLSTIYPLFFFYENLLLAASLIVFLSLLAGWLLVEAQMRNRPGWWLASGVVLGLGCVGKGNLLLAVPFLLVWIVVLSGKADIRRGLAMAGWFMIGTLLMIGPVTIRNAMVQEDFVVLTSNGGLNFFVGNNPEASGMWKRYELPYPGATIDHHQRALETGTQAYRDLEPSEISSILSGKAIDFIRSDPGAFIELLGKKFMLSVNKFEVGNRDNVYFFERFSFLLRLPLPGFWIIGSLGFAGFLLSLRHLRRRFVPFLFVFVPIVTMVVFFVLGRYRLPAVPFLCLFAAHAFWSILGAFRPIRARSPGFVAVLFTGIAMIVTSFSLDSMGARKNLSQPHGAYAGYLVDQGNFEQAVIEASLALEYDPYDWIALNVRAGARERLGDLNGAAEDYMTLQDFHPDDPAGPLALARVQEALDSMDEAAASYEEAVARGREEAKTRKAGLSELTQALVGHGRILVQKGM
ncbi:MAG: glycosyltransferase family 39 protein, partial [Planctomycetota bacterium]